MTPQLLSPIDLVLPRLKDVRPIKDGKWIALCPAHDDQRPSLAIDLCDNGTVLLCCRSHNCTQDAITKAMGITPADLHVRDHRGHTNGHAKPAPAQKKVYASLDDAIAYTSRGIQINHTGAQLKQRFEYHDAAGNLIGVPVRWDLPSGDKEFRQFSPAPGGFCAAGPTGQWPPYRLRELPPTGPIIIVEGEQCQIAAASIGVAATTSAGGSSNAHRTDWSPLAGRDVLILPDCDAPGEKYARAVADRLGNLSPPARVAIVRLPGLAEKEDIVEFIERRREDGKDDAAIVAEIMALPTETPSAVSQQADAPPATANNGQARNGDTTSNNESGRSQINASNGNLPVVTAEAWAAIEAANNPPTLFRYGALPARLETDDDGMPVVRTMTVDRMRHRLARDADWYVVSAKRTGTKANGNAQTTFTPEPVHPPMAIVRDVLATPDPPLPVLTRIVEGPIFAKDGTLQTMPGYHAATQTYFVPAPGFVIPDVPPRPTQGELRDAVSLLMDELIGEFPFVSQTDKTHALAALLCVPARELIDGPTPIHNIEAPCPGTGKTLLINALMVPSLGHAPAAITEGKDDDDSRKRTFAKLAGGPSVFFMDNLRRRVDSGGLASAVTAYPVWEDRLLGKSEIIRVPVRCVWIVTGNNPAFSNEMTRRTIRCRLDSKQDQPWLREGFNKPNLMQWAQENRGQLIQAALTIIRAWIVAGRPPGKQTLGMFESWAQVMGGILDVAGVSGFLGNLQEFYSTADEDGAIWRSFIAAWWTSVGNREVKAAELYNLAIDVGMRLGDKSEQSQKIRLGQKISDARDRVFSIEVGTELMPERAVLKVENAGTAQRACRWRLFKGESGESI